MKFSKKKTALYLICVLCIALFSLAGYFFASSPINQNREDTWSDSGFLKIGHDLVIKNTYNGLSLLDNKDVLSANGLYYAAWTIGDSEPYQNSEGQTVDLYDAQLYLVLSEHKDTIEANNDMIKWLDAGKGNYEVLTEEEIVCNEQPYSLITYNCVNEENPYDRGISVFGVYNNNTICIELTCRENFEEDLRTILLSFLDSCTYGSE